MNGISMAHITLNKLSNPYSAGDKYSVYMGVNTKGNTKGRNPSMVYVIVFFTL
jgi:hypothetical protein